MRCALLLLVMLACALPAQAQRVPVTPPQGAGADTLTPEQRARQRLLSLQPVGEPDSVRAPTDTIKPQTVSVQQARSRPEAAESSLPRDSIMQLLTGITGYVLTEYRGDTAVFVSDSSKLRLLGKPEVSRESSRLAADSSITFDDITGLVCGYGSPVLSAPDLANPIKSEIVCFDVRSRVGVARGACTRMEQGATWNVCGDVYFKDEDLYTHRAIFTDCDETQPHYHFAAEHVKVVRNNILVARNVTLNFQDVKVFWLPFLVQSLSRGRRSGILMPRFGINDIFRNSSRYSRRIEDIGFYWAINDYLGAELTMDWFSDNYTALSGSFDYSFVNKFLNGGLTFSRYWKEEGGREFTLSSRNNWQIDERSSIDVSANYTTSSDFIRRRTFDPREFNKTIDSNISTRRRFDWGSLNLGAQRRQWLNDGTVQWPANASLTVSTISLFNPQPGDERWYSNASWGGGINARFDRRDVQASNPKPNVQGDRSLSTGLNSNFTVGKLRWDQRLDFRDDRKLERAVPDTTIVLEGSDAQSGAWATTLSYTQNLIGETYLSPNVSLGGNYARSEGSGNTLVHSPTRLNFGVGLGTSLYAMMSLPGPFERMRHKLSPSISYNYSPEARADSVQRLLFGQSGAAEQNAISFSLSQTFEVKRSVVATDTADRSTTARDTLAADTATGPRRRQQTPTLMLLSLSTSALAYDFVRARDDGDGFTTATVTNQVTSDLLGRLQLVITHDLFRTPRDEQGVAGKREFAPHFSSASTGFRLDNNSWLIRLLRLGSRDTAAAQAAPPMETGGLQEAGPPVDRTQPEHGLIGTSRRNAEGQPRGAAGTWSGEFAYTLTRPRKETGLEESQMVTGGFNFQPTYNWNVRWQTGYSLTDGNFSDHLLTLTRTLHDWDASFGIVKAQNGNFAFTFNVFLRANPDIKLDYSQQDLRGVDTTRRF